MRLPVVPLLAGGGVPLWYTRLAPDRQRQADRLATRFSYLTFRKTVDRLTNDEALTVHASVRQHFAA